MLKSVNDLKQDDSTKKIIIPNFLQLFNEKLDDFISMRYRTDKPGDDIRLSLDDIEGYYRNEAALSLEEIRQRNLTLTKSEKISSRLVWPEIFNHNFFNRSEMPRNGLKDLDFLRFYPFLKNLVIDIPNLESISGIEFLSDSLETFCLESTAKKVSLLPLAKCTSIKKLYLDGHKNNVDIISQLVNLEKLTLRSVTLDDLSILLPLANLWWLAIKLGGTKKLSFLPNIGKLKYLELWQIRGLNDISFVSKLCHLEYLFLDRLKQVTSLPDFSNCNKLRTILLNMDSITDLSPLLTAKSLEELEFTCGRLRKFRDVLENLHHPNIKQIRTAFSGPPDKYQF